MELRMAAGLLVEGELEVCRGQNVVWEGASSLRCMRPSPDPSECVVDDELIVDAGGGVFLHLERRELERGVGGRHDQNLSAEREKLPSRARRASTEQLHRGVRKARSVRTIAGRAAMISLRSSPLAPAFCREQDCENGRRRRALSRQNDLKHPTTAFRTQRKRTRGGRGKGAVPRGARRWLPLWCSPSFLRGPSRASPAAEHHSTRRARGVGHWPEPPKGPCQQQQLRQRSPSRVGTPCLPLQRAADAARSLCSCGSGTAVVSAPCLTAERSFPALFPPPCASSLPVPTECPPRRCWGVFLAPARPPHVEMATAMRSLSFTANVASTTGLSEVKKKNREMTMYLFSTPRVPLLTLRLAFPQVASRSVRAAPAPVQTEAVVSVRPSARCPPVVAARRWRRLTSVAPLQIRFHRFGRKKLPFFRLVAIDSRKRRDGRPLEVGSTSSAALPAHTSVQLRFRLSPAALAPSGGCAELLATTFRPLSGARPSLRLAGAGVVRSYQEGDEPRRAGHQEVAHERGAAV